jgi:hypothetical protein
MEIDESQGTTFRETDTVYLIPLSQVLAIVNITEKVPTYVVSKVICLQAAVVSPVPVQPS